MGRSEPPRYHVSPSANRDSILRFGLDWKRMSPDQQGIANGRHGQPEADGIFLTHPEIEDARFFVGMGAGRTIDLWRVDVTGLFLEDLSYEGGWWLCREAIPPERLELVETWDTSGGPDGRRRVPLRRERRSSSRTL